jgi:uncharacterized membrane protein
MRRTALITCFAASAAIACAGGAPAPGELPATDTTDISGTDDEPAVRPVASRGTLTGSPGALTFTPCDGVAAPVTDSTGGVLDRARTATGAASDGALFLVGELVDGALVQVARVSPDGESAGCDAPAEPELRAVGTEPFFAAASDEAAGTLSFDSPDLMVSVPRVTPTGPDTAPVFASTAGDDSVTLSLTLADCADGMSVSWYAWTAAVSVNGESFDGCATWLR